MKPIVILMILFVLLVLLYVYRQSVSGLEGFADAKSLVICKAEWCGHCKKAAPEFEKLRAASPLSLNNGSAVTVRILDADEDKAEVAKYNIKGFPSILLVDGNNTQEYPGERTMEGIMAFLNGQ